MDPPLYLSQFKSAPLQGLCGTQAIKYVSPPSPTLYCRRQELSVLGTARGPPGSDLSSFLITFSLTSLLAPGK